MSWVRTLIISTGFCLAIAPTASAQIAEVRAGISEFDEETTGFSFSKGNADENTLGVTAEIIFEEPKFLKWALSPQPYIGGMVNLGGKTSYGGGGLLWRQNFGDKFYGDIAFGLVAHNGTNDIKFEGPLTRENALAHFDRFDREIEFGSTILLREQLTLGYRVTDDWAGEIFLEHLSHGHLFDKDNNDGADIIGIRAAKRF